MRYVLFLLRIFRNARPTDHFSPLVVAAVAVVANAIAVVVVVVVVVQFTLSSPL